MHWHTYSNIGVKPNCLPAIIKTSSLSLKVQIRRRRVILVKVEEEMAEKPRPVQVLYCAVCSLPAEYCEFGPDFEKCKPWIVQNAPHLYPDLVKGTHSSLFYIYLLKYIFVYIVFLFINFRDSWQGNREDWREASRHANFGWSGRFNCICRYFVPSLSVTWDSHKVCYFEWILITGFQMIHFNFPNGP